MVTIMSVCSVTQVWPFQKKEKKKEPTMECSLMSFNYIELHSFTVAPDSPVYMVTL